MHRQYPWLCCLWELWAAANRAVLSSLLLTPCSPCSAHAPRSTELDSSQCLHWGGLLQPSVPALPAGRAIPSLLSVLFFSLMAPAPHVQGWLLCW